MKSVSLLFGAKALIAMRSFFVIPLIFLLASLCFAQEDKGKLTPTPDPSDSSKVYVPRDLEDCFVELKKMLHPDLINDMRNTSEEGMIWYHENLGGWMRN